MTDRTAAQPAPGGTAGPSARRLSPATLITWIVLGVIVIALPFQLAPYRVDQMSTWMTLAIAALGLNLLTGYNGQISIGHGALYGLGAYTAGLMVTRAHAPLLVAVLAAGVVCFVAGVIIGLPALRIKGLYLALVTLAVATLFPLAIEQFRSLTGGNQGLEIRTEQLYRGAMRPRPVKFASPFESLADDQWKYFVFLAVTVVCFLLTRNLIKSRMGRALVAIRDNETAAAVSGIPVARTKIYAFGCGSALAGIAGGLMALDIATIYPSSFTISVSIYFLVAVVIGGAATITGPIVGAVIYGAFNDIVIPELPNQLQPASAVILGGLLIVQVLLAPGGVVGSVKLAQAKIAARRAAKKPEGDASA